MIKFAILIGLIICILLILKNKKKNSSNLGSKSYKYNRLILIVFIVGLLFIIMTSGKLILPQLFQILKIGLPFITKFISI